MPCIDPVWAPGEDGQIYRDEIFRITANILETKTTREWIEILQKKNVWCGEVLTYPEVVNHPQVKHLKNHPIHGES